MSETKVRWKFDITLDRHRGCSPGKDQPNYDIIERLDGTFKLYSWIKTGITSHGPFPDLEFAQSYAEQLEANK